MSTSAVSCCNDNRLAAFPFSRASPSSPQERMKSMEHSVDSLTDQVRSLSVEVEHLSTQNSVLEKVLKLRNETIDKYQCINNVRRCLAVQSYCVYMLLAGYCLQVSLFICFCGTLLLAHRTRSSYIVSHHVPFLTIHCLSQTVSHVSFSTRLPARVILHRCSPTPPKPSQLGPPPSQGPLPGTAHRLPRWRPSCRATPMQCGAFRDRALKRCDGKRVDPMTCINCVSLDSIMACITCVIPQVNTLM